MAEHSPAGRHAHAMEEHRAAYAGFVKGAIVIVIISSYTLVALTAFRFVENWNVLLGFAGLIAGLTAVAIDAHGGSRWFASVVILVVFGLVTAMAVS